MYKILIMALAVCFVSVYACVLKRDEEQTEETLTLEDLKKQAKTIFDDIARELNNFFKYCDDGFENFDKESTDEQKELIEDYHEGYLSAKRFLQNSIVSTRRLYTFELEKLWKEYNDEKNKVNYILDKTENEKKITLDKIDMAKHIVNRSLTLKSILSHDRLEKAKKEIMDKLKQLETKQ